MNDIILDCPFCGSSAVAAIRSGHDYRTACAGCGARSRYCKNDSLAISAWNTRAPLAAHPPAAPEFKCAMCAILAPAQDTPGWKLVPVEPTEEMDAAARAECHRMRGVIDPVIHIWDVMLAAAPAQDTQDAKDAARYDFVCRHGVALFENGHVARVGRNELTAYIDKHIAT